MGHRDPWCRRRCPGDLEEPPGDHRLDHRTSAGRRRSAAAKSESGWTPALPAGPPLGCVLSAGPLGQDRQRLRGARPAARPQRPQRQLCGRPVGGSQPQGHTQATLSPGGEEIGFVALDSALSICRAARAKMFSSRTSGSGSRAWTCAIAAGRAPGGGQNSQFDGSRR